MSLTNQTVNSSLFVLLIRGVQRGLGLISFIILARILSPEDFGIVALATMLVFLCDVISESGTNQYIIQKKHLEPDDIDTAWTLSVVLKSTLAAILILLAPFAAEYFDTPELTLPLQIIAVILPISAMLSPQVFILKRELNYKPIAKIEIYQKVISFFVSIAMALWLQNYWAMIIGVLTSYCSKVILSYVFCFKMPRFTLSNLIKQWSFSKWMLLKAILGYIKSELDTVFVSKLYSVEVLGGFNMMKNLSMIPSREIIQPLAEPLLSTFAKLKHDPSRFNQQVLNCVIFLLIFTAPCSLGFYLYHEKIVYFLLGEKWMEYSLILGLLSFFIINFSLASVLQQALISQAKVKGVFYYDVCTFFGILVLLLVFFDGNVIEFTYFRVFFAMFSILLLVLVVKYYIGFAIYRFVLMLLPILTGLSLASLSKFTYVQFDVLFIELVLNAVIFVCLYGIGLFTGSYLLSNITQVNYDLHHWFKNLIIQQYGRIK